MNKLTRRIAGIIGRDYRSFYNFASIALNLANMDEMRDWTVYYNDGGITYFASRDPRGQGFLKIGVEQARADFAHQIDSIEETLLSTEFYPEIPKDELLHQMVFVKDSNRTTGTSMCRYYNWHISPENVSFWKEFGLRDQTTHVSPEGYNMPYNARIMLREMIVALARYKAAQD